MMARLISPEERARRKALWVPVRQLLTEQERTFAWLHRRIADESGLSYMAFNNIANGYNLTPVWLWRMVCRSLDKPEWVDQELPKKRVVTHGD